MTRSTPATGIWHWPRWWPSVAKLLTDIAPMVGFLFTQEVEIDPAAGPEGPQRGRRGPVLAAAADALAGLATWTLDALEHTLRSLPENLGVKPKVVFQVVRVAIAGSTVSLPLFESLELLGEGPEPSPVCVRRPPGLTEAGREGRVSSRVKTRHKRGPFV